MEVRPLSLLEDPLVVAWDLETTGPDPLVHEILEMAAVTAHGDFTTRVKPLGPIPAAATAVHGIRPQDVASSPGVMLGLEGLLRFLGEQLRKKHTRPARILMVGHNSKTFDSPMLAGEICAAHGLESVYPFFEKFLPGVELWEADTIVAARRARKRGALRATSLSLGALTELYSGQPLTGAHESLADATAVLRLVPSLAEDLECSCWVPQALSALRCRLSNKLSKYPSFESRVSRGLSTQILQVALGSGAAAASGGTTTPGAASSVAAAASFDSHDGTAPVATPREPDTTPPALEGAVEPLLQVEAEPKRARTSSSPLRCEQCGARYSRFFAHEHSAGRCSPKTATAMLEICAGSLWEIRL